MTLLQVQLVKDQVPIQPGTTGYAGARDVRGNAVRTENAERVGECLIFDADFLGLLFNVGNRDYVQ